MRERRRESSTQRGPHQIRRVAACSDHALKVRDPWAPREAPSCDWIARGACATASSGPPAVQRSQLIPGLAPLTTPVKATGGMDASTSDEELVVRARAGEARALDALLLRHSESLTRRMTRLLGRDADADDVVQDALADAIAQLHALREPSAFVPWLHRIALNHARQRFRRRKVWRLLGLDRGEDDASLERLSAKGVDPDAVAELSRIDALLVSAPAEVRIAWVLRHVEGETLESVATLTDCSLATAKRRIAAFDETLRRHLQERA
jgi:RNA polymerase sigma-70 factor, ECF subfamily